MGARRRDSGALETYREAVAITPGRPAYGRAGAGALRARPDPDAARPLHESAALCQEAIAVARQVDARAQEGHALNSYGRDLTLLGTCADGMVAIREALEIGWETRTSDDIGRAYVNLVESFYDCGVTSEAVDVAAVRASARATSSGWPTLRPLHPAQRSGLRVRRSGAGNSPARGRRRPSPVPTGWGAELYRFANTWFCTSRKGASTPSTQGWPARSTCSTRPRARSSSGRSTPRQRRRVVATSTRRCVGAGRTRLDWMAATEDWVADDASVPRRRVGSRGPGRCRAGDPGQRAAADDARVRRAHGCAARGPRAALRRRRWLGASWRPTG